MIVQQFSSPSPKRFVGVFPAELRTTENSQVLFESGMNCIQVGGERSCLFELVDHSLPVAYYSYSLARDSVVGYMNVV